MRIIRVAASVRSKDSDALRIIYTGNQRTAKMNTTSTDGRPSSLNREQRYRSLVDALASNNIGRAKELIDDDSRLPNDESVITFCEHDGTNIIFRVMSSDMLALILRYAESRFSIGYIINRVSVDGTTPLTMAFRNRASKDVIIALLDAGADKKSTPTVSINPTPANDTESFIQSAMQAQRIITIYKDLLQRGRKELMDFVLRRVVNKEYMLVAQLMQIGLLLSFEERFDVLRVMLDRKDNRNYVFDAAGTHERQDEAELVAIILAQDAKDSTAKSSHEDYIITRAVVVCTSQNDEYVFAKATNPFVLKLLFDNIKVRYGQNALTRVINMPDVDGNHAISFPVLCAVPDAVDVFVAYGADPRNAYRPLLVSGVDVAHSDAEAVSDIIRCAIAQNVNYQQTICDIKSNLTHADILAMSPSDYAKAYNDVRIPTRLLVNQSIPIDNYRALGWTIDGPLPSFLAEKADMRERQVVSSDWFRLQVFIKDPPKAALGIYKIPRSFMKLVAYHERKPRYAKRPIGYVPKFFGDFDMTDDEVLLDIADIMGVPYKMKRITDELINEIFFFLGIRSDPTLRASAKRQLILAEARKP